MQILKKYSPFLPNLAPLAVAMAVTLGGIALPAHGASLSDLFDTANTADTGVKNARPLPVNEAFAIFPEQKGNQLTLRFDIKNGYYLYRDKIKLVLPDGVSATPLQFNIAPQTVDDPDFGQVPVFDKNVTATTTLASSRPFARPDSLVKWQGCAKAGQCYPPDKTTFNLANFTSAHAIANKDSKAPKNAPAEKTDTSGKNLTANSATTTTNANATVNPIALPTTTLPTLTLENPPLSEKPTVLPTGNSLTVSESAVANVVEPTSAAAFTQDSVVQNATFQNATFQNANSPENAQITAETTAAASLTATPQNSDPFGLVTHPLWAMGLLFLAGLGLAFTPCVLPMLPIVANIIARQHTPTAKKGLLLTSGYGLGVATSYGILGAIIAVFGQSLGIISWLQNPAILLSFAVLFVLLGLYMLDKLPIRLPAGINHRLNKLTQVGENRLGSVTGSFITGFFSALVVSPCVSAPLAGALAGVATTGNPVIGFFALFMLGLGLSTPLILLGATQGNFMPKSGAWMNAVKTGFALLLFAVALLLMERVFISSWMLGLWGLWFAVVAVWTWHFYQPNDTVRKNVEQNMGKIFTKAISLVLALWSACLMMGMASGATDSWQPLKPLLASSISANSPANSPKPAQRITTLAALSPIIATNQKILVDVTADWCLECRIMDKTLFANPPAPLQNWQVVKLDVTQDTPASRAIYEQLKVFGPPVLLYFDNGKLVHRQNGEVRREEFEQILEKFSN